MIDEIPLVNKSPKFKRKRDEGEDFPDDPPVTEWMYFCPCNFIPLARLKNVNRFFFRGIELTIGSLVLLFVLFLIGFTYIIYIISILPQFNTTTKIISFFETSTVCFLFLWSYFSASCMDPGFLPYNWYLSQYDWYSWEEQLSGIAITETQCVFVDMHQRPQHCSFSRSSGRFVIRGDHICHWISNWVGKRNHKQFLLMMIWGVFYCLSMFFWALLADSKKMPFAIYAMVVVSNVLEITFAFTLAISFFGSLMLVASNKTKIQEMKREEIEEETPCIDALEEVFGTGSKLLWCIPTPAFGKDLPSPTRILH